MDHYPQYTRSSSLEDHLLRDIKGLETRLDKFMEGTNQRLDQLVDLTKHMAAIHERQEHHSDGITRLGNDIRSMNDQMQRIADQARADNKERFGQIEDRITKVEDRFGNKLSGTEKDLENLKETYKADKQSVTHVLGFIKIIFPVIFTVVQGVSAKFLVALQSEISNHGKRITEVERQLESVSTRK